SSCSNSASLSSPVSRSRIGTWQQMRGIARRPRGLCGHDRQDADAADVLAAPGEGNVERVEVALRLLGVEFRLDGHLPAFTRFEAQAGLRPRLEALPEQLHAADTEARLAQRQPGEWTGAHQLALVAAEGGLPAHLARLQDRVQRLLLVRIGGEETE